jgi:hypothetical protein
MLRVKFVVPSGFRGVFAVVADREAAIVPRAADGTWIYRVPEARLVRVASVAPLRAWHATVAAFDNGENLPVDVTGPIAPYRDEAIKLRPLHADSAGRIYFLVGREAEQADLMKNPSHVKIGE